MELWSFHFPIGISLVVEWFYTVQQSGRNEKVYKSPVLLLFSLSYLHLILIQKYINAAKFKKTGEEEMMDATSVLFFIIWSSFSLSAIQRKSHCRRVICRQPEMDEAMRATFISRHMRRRRHPFCCLMMIENSNCQLRQQHSTCKLQLYIILTICTDDAGCQLKIDLL